MLTAPSNASPIQHRRALSLCLLCWALVFLAQETKKPFEEELIRVGLSPSPKASAIGGYGGVRGRGVRAATEPHAAEDGRGIRLDARGASHHAAWAVQREEAGGGSRSLGTRYLLLRGVYGRYLGGPAPSGPLTPCRRAAAQRDRDERDAEAIMWRAVATGGGPGVVLLHNADGRFLRANWRRLPCRVGVAVGDDSYIGPTMKWAVEIIPWKHGQPEFPLARDSEWIKLFDRVCPLLGGLQRWLWEASHKREIRWVLADGSGKFREEDWASFQYSGRSAILLRSRLEYLTLEFCRLTMFIRAGCHGQLTPLVTDLPRSSERLDIVVLRANTRAADELKLPDVDKETAELG